MKQNFYGGLLLGALLTSAAFLARQHYAPHKLPVSAAHSPKRSSEEPQMWLLPKDFSLSKLYTQPAALSVLDAPDAITIHRAGPGSIKVLGHTFAAEGVVPAADDAKTLCAALQAPNAYTLPAACEFQPAVLVRLRRGEHTLDLPVCFTCDEIAWELDNHEVLDSHIGLSEIGSGTLRLICRHAFPNDKLFKSQ